MTFGCWGVAGAAERFAANRLKTPSAQDSMKSRFMDDHHTSDARPSVNARSLPVCIWSLIGSARTLKWIHLHGRQGIPLAAWNAGARPRSLSDQSWHPISRKRARGNGPQPSHSSQRRRAAALQTAKGICGEAIEKGQSATTPFIPHPALPSLSELQRTGHSRLNHGEHSGGRRPDIIQPGLRRSRGLGRPRVCLQLMGNLSIR